MTTDDVQFSVELLKSKGKPFHRQALGRITGTDILGPG